MSQVCHITLVHLQGAQACRERKQRIAPEEFDRLGLSSHTKWWLEGYDMQEEEERSSEHPA